MKLWKKTLLSTLVIATLVPTVNISSVSAEENNSEIQDDYIELNFNNTDISNKFNLSVDNDDLSFGIQSVPVKEHPGAGATYQLIGTFYGSSHKTDKIRELATRLTVNVIGYKVDKVVSLFTNSLFSTFYSGPSTKYYRTRQYYRVFNGKSYAKIVTDTYSDPGRTKLIDTDTFTSVLPL